MAVIVLNDEKRKWLQREHDTWRLVRACFAAYISGKEPTEDKLRALSSLTWITMGPDNTRKVTLPALRTLTGKPLHDCGLANLSDNLAKAQVAHQ